MNCPQCDQEMEKGHFTLPNNVTWYPGKRRKGYPPGQVWLVGRWGLRSLLGKQAEGFLCKACQWASFRYPGSE